MPIKHIVLSGGGPTALKYVGTLQQLEMSDILKISEIESIYGTSAGGMLAVVLCCKYDWVTIIDYFVKRPWHNAFKITPDDVFNMYTKKGIIHQTLIDIMFKPLFDAKNIPMNITMQELYELSGIDLHLFSLELNAFEICDISHKSHPTLQVLTAVHMTSAIPVLFSPVCMDGKCYVDGGLVNNYPLNYCLKDHPEVDDVLAFKNVYHNLNCNIGDESTLVDVVVSIFQNLLKRMNLLNETSTYIPNQINQPSEVLSAEYFQLTLESEDFRRGLVEDGVKTAVEFIKKLIKKPLKIEEEIPL
jgi:predicted acylesterase/phospholipase RssA